MDIAHRKHESRGHENIFTTISLFKIERLSKQTNKLRSP
jgi:hypothetical protein